MSFIDNLDTIAAIATPYGIGGVGVIRISGPAALQVFNQIVKKKEPIHAKATYGVFKNSISEEKIDEGLALFFKAPHSFTGEDVLELHGHGGPVVIQMLLEAVLETGVRMARPGEFSERAFLNNKMDLTKAEAIADLINARSKSAAKAAFRSLQGSFSKEVNHILEGLIQLRIYVESAIDFPEEEIDFLSDTRILNQALEIEKNLANLLSRAEKGALLQTGLNLVILGRPNAGKSSLLNQLTEKDTAIVTDVPGTTRDLLKELILINGVPVHVFDTAGLRETEDIVEKEGIKRAHQAIKTADCVLLLLEPNQEILNNNNNFNFIMDNLLKNRDELLDKIMNLENLENKDKNKKELNILNILNKVDLIDKNILLNLKENKNFKDWLFISAKTGEKIEDLRQSLLFLLGLEELGGSQVFSARTRHIECLKKAWLHLKSGITALEKHKAGELLAEECRLAQENLNEITGAFSSDDLLGRIFSSFCIGK